MKELFKEWYEAKDEKEESELSKMLAKKYGLFEVYNFRYQGNDGKFHREVFVFNR